MTVYFFSSPKRMQRTLAIASRFHRGSPWRGVADPGQFGGERESELTGRGLVVSSLRSLRSLRSFSFFTAENAKSAEIADRRRSYARFCLADRVRSWAQNF